MSLVLSGVGLRSLKHSRTLSCISAWVTSFSLFWSSVQRMLIILSSVNAFLSSVPNGGLTTFGGIVLNSFGFTELQVLLVEIPRSGNYPSPHPPPSLSLSLANRNMEKKKKKERKGKKKIKTNPPNSSNLRHNLHHSRLLHPRRPGATHVHHGLSLHPPLHRPLGNEHVTQHTRAPMDQMGTLRPHSPLRTRPLSRLDTHPLQRRRTDQKNHHLLRDLRRLLRGKYVRKSNFQIRGCAALCSGHDWSLCLFGNGICVDLCVEGLLCVAE